MQLLTGRLALHDIDDAEQFCARILNTHLARSNGTLRPADRDDALAWLIATCWEISLTYEPGRCSSFSRHAHGVLSRRIVDWWRNRFGRDQTNTDWYRRLHPNSRPADPEQRRNVRIPLSLDAATDNGRPINIQAPDDSEHDPLEFTVRALTGDPASRCHPPLADILKAGHSSDIELLNLRPHATDERATGRARDAPQRLERTADHSNE